MGLSLHENTKIPRKKTQNQLYQNSDQNNQRSTSNLGEKKLNQEKANLKTVGKLCGLFTFPCSTPFPVSVAIMKTMILVKNPGLSLWGNQSRLYSQNIVFIYSNLSGGYLKDRCKALVFFPNSELSQDGKIMGNPWEYCKANEQPAGDWEYKTRVLKAREENLGREFLWEVRTFQSSSVYWEDLESYYACLEHDACSEKDLRKP